MTAPFPILSGEVKVDASDAVKGLAAATDKLAEHRVAQRAAADEAKRLSAELRRAQSDTGSNAEQINRLAAALKAAEAAEIEAAAAVRKSTAALEQQRRAIGDVSQTSGAARAGMINLGRQLNDVATGLSTGTPPAQVFSQQVGQLSDALAGMGDAAGKVGQFLGGPWGIALTTAATLLIPYIASLMEGDAAQREVVASAEELEASYKAVAEASRIANYSVAEGIRLAREKADTDLDAARKARDKARADLEAARAEIERARSDVLGRGGNFGGNFVLSTAEQNAAAALAEINRQQVQLNNAEMRAERKARSARTDRAARVATDPTFAIVERANQQRDALTKLNLPEAEEQRRKIAINREEKAALDALASAEKAAAAAKRDGAKATALAAREERERQQFIGAMTQAINDAIAGQDALGRALQDRFDPVAANQRRAQETSQQIDTLEQAGTISPEAAASYRAALVRETNAILVDLLEREMPDIFGDAGRTAARTFGDDALTSAVAIGQVIGGAAGGLIRTAAGLVQGVTTGNYTGVGGRSGGLLTMLAGAKGPPGSVGAGIAKGFQSSVFTTAGVDQLGTQLKPVAQALKPMVDAVKGAFGVDGGKFGEFLGKAGGGFATGSAVSGLANAIGIKLNQTGSQIGGAIGSAIGGPLGSLIGSIGGGIIGNLIATKSGSTTVSASGGKISSSSSGNAAVTRATSGMGNSLIDAVQAIADQLGAEVGDFAVSIGKRGDSFRVDRSGTGQIRGSTVTGTKDQAEALQLAIADALADGAIVASPRVQQALQRYSDNLNKAVGEALKVKGLEDALANQANPFATLLRDFERQAKKRLETARDYGFDVVEIEKLNATERKKVIDQALQQSVGSAKALLNDLQFGSRAEGSFSDRRAALIAERDRLQGLVAGGDIGAGEQLTQVLQQLLDVSKEGYGIGGTFAADRAGTIDLLQQLIQQRQTQIEAAATTARGNDPQLSEANASLDDIAEATQRAARYLEQLVGGGLSVGGGRALVADAYVRNL